MVVAAAAAVAARKKNTIADDDDAVAAYGPDTRAPLTDRKCDSTLRSHLVSL